MANKSYPIETVFRAFVMRLDYLSYAEIAEYDGMPHEETVARWSKQGEGTEGYPWDKIREMTASKRALVSYERQIGDRALAPWTEKVDGMKQDLMDTRDFVMNAIKDGTIKEAKVKDLIDVIKAEALVHGEATQRTEAVADMTNMLAKIVMNRVRQNLKDQNLADRILDLIAQDFEVARSTGGDPDAISSLSS